MIDKHFGDVSYLQLEQYQPFPNLLHGIFTRLGGFSNAPYTGLNTSSPFKGPGDHRETVLRNRKLTLQALGIADYPNLTLWQVHGAEIAIYDATDDWRTDWAESSYYEQPWTPATIRRADAVITRERGTALVLSFADCVPLVFYDPEHQAIGIAHGGWRGTARGIAVATIRAMAEHFGSQPDQILTGIGPSIGVCCYEVSDHVRRLFMGEQAFDDVPTHEDLRGIVRESAVFSTSELPDRESLRLNLWETNRNQFLLAGILPEHIESANICTSCHRDRFFSHRGENGTTGRFPVIMALQRE